MRSLRLATVAVGVAVTIPMAGAAFAAPAPDLNKSEVKTWTFIGKAAECGGVAGSHDVSSKWLPHAGLVDAKGKADKALELVKSGDTADCSSAGATITKVAGLSASDLTLGYDISDDSHCGAGAPRFNVVTSDDVTHFVGCSYLTAAPLGNGWTHRETDANTQVFPAFEPNTTVKSIDIVFDEGTDNGTGKALLDNIEVNGTVVGH
jgi:hypothetical protein